MKALCIKCNRPPAPVSGIVPLDADGLCWYCRHGITPPAKPIRRTVPANKG